METFFQDLYYGFRGLRRTPGLAIAAVMTLALGIGANTAMFSVINAVLLRPLPFHDPDRLVIVSEGDRQGSSQRVPVAPANFIDLRDQNQDFDRVAASMPWVFIMTGQGDPERIDGARASADLFPALGVTPIIGREFSVTDDQPGGERVVIVSHGLWQRRFGGDPGIVGKSLTLNGQSHTVIGIMPADFLFLAKQFDLWVPFAFAPQEASNRGFPYITVVARLKRGVAVSQAQAEMDTIAGRLEQEYPKTNSGKAFKLVSLREHMVGNVRPALLILLAVVALVLLIACINVANLLLARASAREREFSIRSALGASRLRIIRQLFTESLLLGLIGGAIGVFLAFLGSGLLSALIPSNLPRVSEVEIDGQVLGYTFIVSLLTALIFGLAPALHGSKPDLNVALKEGSRGSTGGASGRRLRSLLVVSEVALALVLLIGAGLMTRSFLLLQSTDMGFNPRNVLTMRVSLPRPKYPKLSQQAAFYQDVINRFKELPGVEAAAAVSSVPIGGSNVSMAFDIEGRAADPGKMNQAFYRAVSSDYFRAMGIQLKKGRSFTDRDTEGAPPVALINEAMARLFWPDEDPLGKRIRIDFPPDLANYGPPVSREIVGVVGDVKHASLEGNTEPEMYASCLQNPLLFMTLIVRAARDPKDLASAARGEVWALDKDQPVARVMTMEQVLEESVAQPRFRTLLMMSFAVLALVLAAMGIHGVLAYVVVQRTREMGIRMALGAKSTDVLWLVIRYGLKLTLVGVVIGLAAAFALTRFLASLLYSVSAIDAATFLVAPLLIVLVALLSVYAPARKAMKVDPMLALRYE
jgi:putative ABC transport system permease protein